LSCPEGGSIVNNNEILEITLDHPKQDIEIFYKCRDMEKPFLLAQKTNNSKEIAFLMACNAKILE